MSDIIKQNILVDRYGSVKFYFPQFHARNLPQISLKVMTGTEICIFLSCYLSIFVSCLAHDGSI